MPQVLVLFDIDGTLLLTGGAGTRALDRVFARRYQVERAMQGIRPDGMTDGAIIRDIFRARLGREPVAAETADILAEYVGLLAEELADAPRFRVLPGAVEAVAAMAARAGDGVVVGVATGNVRAAAQLKLERAGLWHHVVLGGYGDDSEDRPTLVARAVERGRAHMRREVAGREVIVVGDTVRDVAAARAVGAYAVVVPSGSTDRATLAAAGPDLIVDSLAELAAALDARPPA